MCRSPLPWLLLAAILAALLALPGVQAAFPTLHVHGFRTPAPVGDAVLASTRVELEYDCNAVDAGNWTQAHVTFHVREAPAWLVADVEPSNVSLAADPQGCAWGETRVASANLTARALPDAPALVPGVVQVEARVWNGSANVSAWATTTVRAGFVGLFAMEALRMNATAKPQEVAVFPLELENAGNGMTKFFFEIVDKSAGVSVPVPAPIVLEPPREGATHTRVTVPVTALTPYRTGYVEQEDWFTLRVTAVSAEDPSERGASQEVTFRVRTEGAYVPAPAPVLLVATGMALAMAWRRRR